MNDEYIFINNIMNKIIIELCNIYKNQLLSIYPII